MNKDIYLLPHNEEGFKKLKECLKYNQLVGLNHATGTGKSFIILKYLYENRDKRILFLSPSYPINDQLLHEHAKELGIDINEFNKLDTLIYTSLLKMDMDELVSNYDIIVLDEYHRCGAKKWGIKVNELLECVKKKYPQKKVIGTTATEIRYLDNERNMNNILFDGVCASTLTPREETVLRLRFGFHDGKVRQLEEVAKIFNVTCERIRQIEAKALRKLRHPSRSRVLKDFIN